MSAVYSIKVDDTLDTKLDFLVEKTGHKKAIESYCKERQDYLKAAEALHAIENGEELSNWADVKKSLGY